MTHFYLANLVARAVDTLGSNALTIVVTITWLLLLLLVLQRDFKKLHIEDALQMKNTMPRSPIKTLHDPGAGPPSSLVEIYKVMDMLVA